MPIFEYKCADCGKISEFLELAVSKVERKADSRAGRSCPACGGKKLTKQFSTFAAVVKQPAVGGKCHTCPSGRTCPHSGL